MNNNERCPTCGSRHSEKLTEEEIINVLNNKKWEFDDNRASAIAKTLIENGFGFKDILPWFSFKDGDAINAIMPELRLLPGEVRRIEYAFKENLGLIII